MAILGELDRAGLLNAIEPTVHSATLREALQRWDICQTRSESVSASIGRPLAACRLRWRSARIGVGGNSILTALPVSFATWTRFLQGRRPGCSQGQSG